MGFSLFKIGLLEGKYLVNFRNQGDSFLQILAKDGEFKKYHFNQLKIDANGCLKKHFAKFNIKNKALSAIFDIEGNYEKPQWVGKLKALQLDYLTQHWKLFHPALISCDDYAISLEKLNLFSEKSQIQINGLYPYQGGMQGLLHAKDLNLEVFNSILSDRIRISGNLNLNAEIDFNKKQAVKIQSEVTAGEIKFIINANSEIFKISKLQFNSSTQKEKLIANFQLTSPENRLSANVTLPAFNPKNWQLQPITGQINLQTDQLRFVELFLPVIKNMTGKIAGNYLLEGTLTKPRLQGHTILSNGNFEIPKLKLKVENIAITAKNENNAINFEGQLHSGNGQLNFKGTSKWENNQLPVDLNLEGKNLLICNTPELVIQASPNLHLSISNDDLILAGKVLIPEAIIRSKDFGAIESASDDIIFVEPNGKKKEDNNTLRVFSSLQLTLGNKIFLNTKGIKGQVKGQIQIDDSPTKATVAYGQLWLQDGSYRIYSKTLQIDEGKLIFTGGPIGNPGLNIKASRSLQVKSNQLFTTDEQIKVGVNVGGVLQDPKIHLFSEPTGKTPEDILSYLVLGRSLSSLNTKDNGGHTKLLLQAADALNFGGDNKLINMKNKIKNSLGLAELDIDSLTEINPGTQKTIEHTAFVLGKYLSPKFYVNYSFDLFDYTNTFKIKYLINKYLTIQSVTNMEKSGLDILYTIEKD